MFDSVTSSVLKTAMDGLAMRQRVTADNVANVNTPEFLAGRVQFEDALAQAVNAGQGFDGETGARITQAALADQATQPTMSRSLEPTRTDGNNVNLDHEVISNIDTQLRYQLMIRAMDDQYSTLRTVAGSAG
ncbi:flagellar basal body rod protein FlgB [Cryptosporangium sp. NPDC051539]|uniref:flagellar basal body rod protein FlgB n=1 Tax=Cryptosporangium sp. NPDC051539 TaxID=3363962 RepID=UPI00379996E5